MSHGALYVMPSMRIPRIGVERVMLTQKFVEGVEAYQQHWPGEVAVLAQPTEESFDHLDARECELRALPFRLQWGDFADSAGMAERLAGAGAVQATLDYQTLELPEICRRLGSRLVYVAEATLRTRKQMIAAETGNPLLRARRYWWTTRLEQKQKRAVAQATGIQCNGTPTYEAYGQINPRPLLFFDTRVGERQLANVEVLRQRLSELKSGKPLRLAFTGRLVAIKGADHLPRVARELARLGVDFTLDIVGGGAMESLLREKIAQWNLGERVRLRGVMDFASELLPFVTRNVDLFVCCHRQGDPSCTYLETMACAVPVIGYDNEALAGLVRHSGVGWATAMDDPAGLARQIASLSGKRDELARAAEAARGFAAKNTFETTFENRVKHMMQ